MADAQFAFATEGGAPVTTIRIMFSRYSAFYSPLIATKAAGFLEQEGLSAQFSVAGPDKPAQAKLADGEVDLIQSAVSASWSALERDALPPLAHFAQINQKDGFFVVGRRADSAFGWDELEGAEVLADHGGQPLAMFKYALQKQGVEFASLNAVDAGGPDQMERAFRDGRGDFVHLQGPAPQQLEKEGIGHVVASVGEAIGTVAFSSLCAMRAWLETETAQAFMRAYAKARAWVRDTPPEEVARIEAAEFEGIGQDALAATIAAYQRLSNWGGPLEITREAYERALDVFQYNEKISQRWPYEQVVALPPES